MLAGRFGVALTRASVGLLQLGGGSGLDLNIQLVGVDG